MIACRICTDAHIVLCLWLQALDRFGSLFLASRGCLDYVGEARICRYFDLDTADLFQICFAHHKIGR